MFTVEYNSEYTRSVAAVAQFLVTQGHKHPPQHWTPPPPCSAASTTVSVFCDYTYEFNHLCASAHTACQDLLLSPLTRESANDIGFNITMRCFDCALCQTRLKQCPDIGLLFPKLLLKYPERSSELCHASQRLAPVEATEEVRKQYARSHLKLNRAYQQPSEYKAHNLALPHEFATVLFSSTAPRSLKRSEPAGVPWSRPKLSPLDMEIAAADAAAAAAAAPTPAKRARPATAVAIHRPQQK